MSSYRVTFKLPDGKELKQEAQVVQGKASAAQLNELLLRPLPAGTTIVKIQSLTPHKVEGSPKVAQPVVPITPVDADEGGEEGERLAGWDYPDTDDSEDRISQLEQEKAELEAKLAALTPPADTLPAA